MSITEVYDGPNIDSSIVRVYQGKSLLFERTLYNASTQALLDQATADGYTAPTGAVLTALDTLIIKLKTDGVWGKKDAIFLYATNGDSDFALYDLKDPTRSATRVNSPTFTSLEGYTAGTTSYINTGFKPATDGVQLTLSSVSKSIYLRNDTGFNNYNGVTATSGFNPGVFIFPGRNGFRSVDHALCDSLSRIANPANTAAGFHHSSKTGTTKRIYYNGAQLGTDFTVSAGSVPTGDSFDLALNNLSSGSPTFIGQNQQIAYSSLGGYLTSDEQSDEYDAIQAYMTTLGTEV